MSVHARTWLFVLSFSEASFFVVPAEVLLLPMLIADKTRWVHLAWITTMSSVLGALFGYLLGAFAFGAVGEPLIALYGLENDFAKVGMLFDTNTFWTLFVAAFTPIPFKVFVLAGGFFRVDLIAFIAASILGRGMRYYLFSWIVARFGAHMARLFVSYFRAITIGAVVLALVWYLFLH